MKQYFVFAGIAVVASLFVFVMLGTKTVQTITKEVNLGSVVGPDSSFACETHNGVGLCFGATRINATASTTVCALKSPTATSTLNFGFVSITTGTSTDVVELQMAKDTTPSATTTSLGYLILPAGTTGAAFATTSLQTQGSMIFAPNTFFTVKMGGANYGPALQGTCRAEWQF